MILKKINQFLILISLSYSVPFGNYSFAADPVQPTPKQGFAFKDIQLTPVLSGGRIKPFDEFARETLLLLTGSRSFAGFDPSEFLISLLVQPREWSEQPIIRVGHESVRKQLLLAEDRKFFSPLELLKNNAFLQYAEGLSSTSNTSQVNAAGANAQATQKDPRTEELKRVVERVTVFQALIEGNYWKVTPTSTLSDGMKQPTVATQQVYEVLKAYLESDAEKFAMHANQMRTAIEAETPQFAEVKNHLIAETIYNRFRPFLQAMIFYLCAGLLWLFSSRFNLARLMAKFLTTVAILVHVFGFALRCYVAGRPPVTNMYESIIWVSMGTMIFACILYYKFRQVILLSTATLLSGFALFAADSAPIMMDPTIRPLVPVLRSNYWLTIHVLTITLSYAAFMLAMGISNTTLFLFYRRSRTVIQESKATLNQRITSLNLLSYRSTQFGVVLLAAGTILGGIWADYSWGRFWGWDPKEVWALIALLAYLAILHGRFSGWVGAFAYPLWTVICFSSVLMAWYGVNFVLGVGLHSYGFSSGGQGVVGLFLLAQFIYCFVIAWDHKKNTTRTSAPVNG
jgi:cytochrome c-type biogenesis protein CcsB